MIVLLDIPNRLLRDLAERLEPADDMSALILRALYFAVKQIPRYQGPEAVRTAVATQADTAVSTKLPTTGSTALPTTQPGTVSAVTDQDISDQLDCLPWKEMKSGKGYWARFEELPQPYRGKFAQLHVALVGSRYLQLGGYAYGRYDGDDGSQFLSRYALKAGAKQQ